MSNHTFEVPDYYREHIPARLIAALEDYVLHHRRTGDFLTAVLKNDLRDAIGRAAPESMACMKQIIGLLHNFAPSRCWGSPAKVAAWLGVDVEDL